jgi:copper oxidase (laccase) domain-containing protein
VVPAAVGQLRSIRAGRVIAAVGPCISRDAFEVGAEVLDAFDAQFPRDGITSRRPDGKGHVDLRAAVRRQLIEAGVSDVDMTDRCTFVHTDEFYSHRREQGVTGRMAAVIGPRGTS